MRSCYIALLSFTCCFNLSASEELFPRLTGERANGLEIQIDDIETEFRDGLPVAVWGIAKKEPDGLYRLNGTNWIQVSLPEYPKNLLPYDLIRGLEGEIFCLWKSQEEEVRCHLISHRGDEFRIRFSFPDVIPMPQVSLLAQGGIYVTGKSQTVLSQKSLKDKPVFRDLPEQTFHPQANNPDGSFPSVVAPIRVVEMPDGAVWLWSQSIRGSERLKRLNGVIRIKGDEGIVKQGIPFEGPASPISVLETWMEKRAFIAVAGAGFVDFDASLKNPDFRSGTGQSFHFIERLLKVDDHWFLIATPRPNETEVNMSNSIKNAIAIKERRFYDPAVETSSLYEAKDGKMILVTRHLDDEPQFDWFDRPVVSAEGGFWTCVDKGKLAFVAFEEKEARVQKVSKNTGLPLESPSYIVPHSHDFFVALDRIAKKACLIPTDPAKHQIKKEDAGGKHLHRGRTFVTSSMLGRDDEGKIYGWFNHGREFRVWEDENWKELSLPEEFGALGEGIFGIDDQRRFWAFGEGRTDTAFFDPAEGEWSVYRLPEDALENHMASGSRIRAGDQVGIYPVSSSSDPIQICYVTLGGTIRYFDGKKWLQFPLASVTNPRGEESKRDPKLTGAPFFRNGTHLVLPVEYSNWERSEPGLWSKQSSENKAPTPLFRKAEHQPGRPPAVKDFITSSISSHFWDHNGVCWICDSKGGLWKAVGNVVIPVFDKDEVNPLSHGQAIQEVVVDQFGNAFLRLAYGSGKGLHLQVLRNAELPVGKCKIESVEQDKVNLKFSGADYFQWRIDGGTWSPVAEKDTVSIDRLIPGEHRIELRSWNGELVPSPTIVEALFQIEGMGEGEFDTMIKHLSSTEVERREAAVSRLVSQGEQIIPKLDAALKGADSSAKWWISAVIQEIERQR